MTLFSSRAFICLANSLPPSVSDFRDDSFKIASGSGHGVGSTMLPPNYVGNAVAVFRIDSRRLSTWIVFTEIQTFKVFIGLYPYGSGRHGIRYGDLGIRDAHQLGLIL